MYIYIYMHPIFIPHVSPRHLHRLRGSSAALPLAERRRAPRPRPRRRPGAARLSAAAAGGAGAATPGARSGKNVGQNVGKLVENHRKMMF